MMLLALRLAVRPWGTVTALIVALLVSLSWSAALLFLRTREQLGRDGLPPGADA